MFILGINAYHGDAAAAIICDGRLIAAAEVGAAGFFGGFDLFGGADIGLGEFHFFARAFYLALVALG